MTGKSATAEVNLSTWGLSTVELAVTGAGDGVSNDHADRADAHLWSSDGA